MKLTPEEIQKGFRELGLGDAKMRDALSRIARIVQPEPGPRYETITAGHTILQSRERADAELESDSQRS